MTSRYERRGAFRDRGFSLLELVAVAAVMVLLLGLSGSWFGRSRATALKTGTDQLTVVVEQARTSAITRRRPVALAILEPGQPGFDDGRCRLGLFELDSEVADGEVKALQLQRWEVLPGGVAFFGGPVDGLENIGDLGSTRLSWRSDRPAVEVRMLVFDPRGGLSFPVGSRSVAVRLGNGTYLDGMSRRSAGGGTRTVRIGRTVARPWNLDRG